MKIKFELSEWREKTGTLTAETDNSRISETYRGKDQLVKLGENLLNVLPWVLHQAGLSDEEKYELLRKEFNSILPEAKEED